MNTNIFSKLWNSATFTQYGKYLSTLGSAFFLLPVVLSTFEEKDIAIWLLISTVTMFATILSQRLQITFMRVVSFAFAGAKDYRPIVAYDEKRGDGSPNWQGIQDIFTTLSKTFYLVSFFTTVVVILGLSFGINNLTVEFKSVYLLIVVIVASSTLFTQNFLKYNIFLMGFNKVAMVNRWNTLFGIFGIVGSIIIVKSGAGLLYLVAWQLIVPVASAIRDKWLFDGFLKNKSVSNSGIFDKNILLAVKEPLWKGLVAHVSQMGMVQFSGVIFTMYGEPSIVASYLFSLRILTMLAEFAQVPFSSKHPYFSKLRSEGNVHLLAKVLQNRIFITLLIYSMGVVLVLLLNDYILKIIGSNVSFVTNQTWLLMGLLYGVERANVLYQAISATANHVVLYFEQVLSALISLAFLFLLVKTYGITGIILALFLPRTILFNIKALQYAARSLQQSTIRFGLKTILPIVMLVVIYLGHLIVYEK